MEKHLKVYLKKWFVTASCRSIIRRNFVRLFVRMAMGGSGGSCYPEAIKSIEPKGYSYPANIVYGKRHDVDEHLRLSDSNKLLAIEAGNFTVYI